MTAMRGVLCGGSASSAMLEMAPCTGGAAVEGVSDEHACGAVGVGLSSIQVLALLVSMVWLATLALLVWWT